MRPKIIAAILGLAAFGAVAWKLEALGVEEQRKIAELVQNKLPARFRKTNSPSENFLP